MAGFRFVFCGVLIDDVGPAGLKLDEGYSSGARRSRSFWCSTMRDASVDFRSSTIFAGALLRKVSSARRDFLDSISLARRSASFLRRGVSAVLSMVSP